VTTQTRIEPRKSTERYSFLVLSGAGKRATYQTVRNEARGLERISREVFRTDDQIVESEFHFEAWIREVRGPRHGFYLTKDLGYGCGGVIRMQRYVSAPRSQRGEARPSGEESGQSRYKLETYADGELKNFR
jgi:hypothetical protein